MPETRRRLLLHGAATAWAASLGYALYRYRSVVSNVDPDISPWVTLTGVVTSVERGTALAFQGPDGPGLLIHHTDGTWVAFSAHCTHLRCPVNFEPSSQRILCPCHQGVFDARTGEPQAGPPPEALPAYPFEIRGDDIVVDTRPSAPPLGESIRAAGVKG